MTISAAKKQIISEAVANLERAAGLLAKSGSVMPWSDRLERVEIELLGQAWEGQLYDRIDQLERIVEQRASNQGFAGLAKAAGIGVGTLQKTPHHNYQGVTGGLLGLYSWSRPC